MWQVFFSAYTITNYYKREKNQNRNLASIKKNDGNTSSRYKEKKWISEENMVLKMSRDYQISITQCAISSCKIVVISVLTDLFTLVIHWFI